jgi:hypothetical protein
MGDVLTVYESGELSVFRDEYGMLLAGFPVGSDGEPLPGCDPAGHGYPIASVRYVGETVAVVEVVALPGARTLSPR